MGLGAKPETASPRHSVQSQQYVARHPAEPGITGVHEQHAVGDHRARAEDGRVLWDMDTARDFDIGLIDLPMPQKTHNENLCLLQRFGATAVAPLRRHRQLAVWPRLVRQNGPFLRRH
jgi:hypothetical protein